MVSETVMDVVLGRPDRFSGIVMLVGFISVIIYYLFSRSVSGVFREGSLKFLSRLGTYFLLLTGGFLYSQIYMVEGIDLASSIFIMWFRRSYEEIRLYIATHSAAVAGIVGTPMAVGSGIVFGMPLVVVGITLGAVAVTGIGGYAFYRSRRQTPKSQSA
jgi:hypothetical protein